MKNLFLVFSLLACGSSVSFAKGEPKNITIRCQGLNAKSMVVGIDVELDPVQRLVAVTSFEGDSTFMYNINKDLGAPSHAVELDKNGQLVLFSFKSFNDGLEENLKVLYVSGRPDLTVLKLQDMSNRSYLVKRNIQCRILKNIE